MYMHGFLVGVQGTTAAPWTDWRETAASCPPPGFGVGVGSGGGPGTEGTWPSATGPPPDGFDVGATFGGNGG